MFHWYLEDATKTEGGEVRLRLEGDLTVETTAELKGVLLDALEHSGDLLVDARGAQKVDIASLQLLCAAHRTAISLGKKMVLAHHDEVLAAAVQEAGYLRQRACLLSSGERVCLWLPPPPGEAIPASATDGPERG